MKITEVIDGEYENISETVVDRVVSPKKIEKLEYEVMPEKRIYAEGVYALQNSYAWKETEVPSHLWYDYVGRRIVRPLTCRENILARVEDFETLKNKDGSTRTIEDKLKLFNVWLDSCMGVAYSSKSEDDFMIVPVCKELITIPKKFSNEYLLVDYVSLQGKGVSLKRSQAKYDTPLSESEVIAHPAWIASVEEDVTLLCTYASIFFNYVKSKEGKAMSFLVAGQSKKDQIRALLVDSLEADSNAIGYFGLNFNSSFLRATPPSS